MKKVLIYSAAASAFWFLFLKPKRPALQKNGLPQNPVGPPQLQTSGGGSVTLPDGTVIYGA